MPNVFFRRSLGACAAAVGVALGFGCSSGNDASPGAGDDGGASGSTTRTADSGGSDVGSSSSSSGTTAASSSSDDSSATSAGSSAASSTTDDSATPSVDGSIDGGAGDDGSVLDSSVADSSLLDGSVIDGSVADSPGTDAGTSDTSVADAAPMDSAASDGGSGALDAGGNADALDAIAVDAGADATLDANLDDSASDSGAMGDGSSDAGLDGADGGVFARYWFDTTTEGWSILSTSDTTLSTSTLGWSGANGDPTPGDLRLTVPFSAPSQSIIVGLAPSPAADLTGRTVTVHLFLESGLSTDANHPGAIQVFAQNGAPNWSWVSAGWTTIDSTKAGQWITTSLDVAAAAAGNAQFDPTRVATWGVQILTGGAAATPNYSAAVLDFDSVTVQ